MPPDFSRLRAGIARRGFEAWAYARPLIRRLPPKKFVIFAQGRTGSWLLYDFLNSNPDVHCDKEILAARVFFPERYVKGLAAASDRGAYGFHAQVRHLRDTQTVSPGRFLRRMHRSGWQIIYLRRRNSLRQSLSAMIAVERRIWCETAESPLRPRTHIDCDRLLEWLEQREVNGSDEQKALENLPFLELVYEDDLLEAEDHQETMNRVFEYLGLPAVKVETDLVRISSDRMADSVENYDEVVRVVSRTKYAALLD